MKSTFAFVASDIARTLRAAQITRRHSSVYTQFSGSRKKQFQRANRNAYIVIDLDDPEECCGELGEV